MAEWDIGAEQRLKAEMGLALRRPGLRVEDSLWERAQSAHCFRDALNGSPGAKRELRTLLRAWAREDAAERRKRERKSGHKELPDAPPAEMARSWAVARELARIALEMNYLEDDANPISPLDYLRTEGPRNIRDRGVVPFRNAYLSGRVLSREEAATFIAAPGLKWLPSKDFRDGTRSALTSTLHFLAVGESANDNRRFPRRLEPLLFDESSKLRPVLFAEPMPRRLWIPNERGQPSGGWTEVFEGTVLDELRDIADRLSRWLLWDPALAVWFILTGEVPLVPIIEVRCVDAPITGMHDFEQGLRLDNKRAHRRIRIKLEVEPWITVATMSRVFQAFQRELLGVKQTHPPAPDWIFFFDFVSEHRHSGREMPEIRKLWNGRAPISWKYAQKEHQNFIRDYWRVHRQIMQLKPADPRPDKEARK